MTLTLRGVALNVRAVTLNVRAITRKRLVVTSGIKNQGGKKMGTNFEYGKILAGEGSVLLILSPVPYVGWILGLIGVILFLRGINELSNYFQDNEIYQNSLNGVKFYIVAIIAEAIAIAALVVGLASVITIKGFSGFGTPGLVAGMTVFAVTIVVAFIFFRYAATHFRKTFNTLAQKSGEQSFIVAADFLWWGAILSIVLIGLILIFIAWIFSVLGFFSMRSKKQDTSQPYAQPFIPSEAQPQQAERFCSNCGASVATDAIYCAHCGKQLTV
jgi:uncharacterized membrane protein